MDFFFGIGSSLSAIVIIFLILGDTNDGVVGVVNSVMVDHEMIRFEHGKVWYSLLVTFEPKKLTFELATKRQRMTVSWG